MPDSREKVLCEAVRTMLAALTAFQSWVGADADEESTPEEVLAAATARVWLEAVDAAGYSLNGAMVRLHGASYDRETVSGFNLWPEGTVEVVFHGVVSLEGDEGTGYLESFMTGFMEAIRQIKWAFMDSSLTGTKVQFVRVTELPGPWMDEEEEARLMRNPAGDFYLRWGFAAELGGNG